MGLVTDVFWNCPGCGSRELAQVGGYYGDELSTDAIPVECGGLRWNPPCRKCGKFRLMPEPFTRCTPQPIEQEQQP